MNKPFLLLVACAGLAVVVTIRPARSEFQAIGESTPSQTKTKKANSLDARIDAIQTRMSEAESAINTANKNLSCDGDSQCEVLEMGDRHCGGPSRYLVVSSANPKLAEVKAKIAAFTRAEKEMNTVQPPLSCTDAPQQPSTLCKGGKCQ